MAEESMLPVYVDIDGTLTDAPGTAWGQVRAGALDVVRALCKQREVVVWSGRGTAYAKAFCEQHGIKPVAALGKPGLCFDDNSVIRPTGLAVATPEQLLQWKDT